MNDEFTFINKITPTRKKQPSLLIGIGDDAAVYQSKTDVDQVVCVDSMCEGVHFTKQTMSSFAIGWKALAVNISDIAAMGGKPLYFLVSIAIASNWQQSEIEEIYRGMEELAAQYDIDLIGGDTVSSRGGLMITVTVIGEVEQGQATLRSSAKKGDVIFITGTTGESAAGLELLLQKGRQAAFAHYEEALVKAHQFPQPQVIAGRLLVKSNKRISLNDISDGLASEVNEIAEASNVSIVIDENLVPISNHLQQYSKEKRKEWIYFGGEDYQLVGTVSSQHWEKLKAQFQEEQIKITKIGTVHERMQSNVLLKSGEQMTPLEKKGYNHFRKGEQ